MKENSRKEDIRILEEMIENANIENMDMNDCFGGEHIEAIEHILPDYKRVLKENEELKKFITEGITIEPNSPYKNYQLDFLRKNFIPVQKVKDKIEKEIKYHERNILEIENTTMLKGKTAKEEAEIEFNKYAIVVLKKMLQELLEGRK